MSEPDPQFFRYAVIAGNQVVANSGESTLFGNLGSDQPVTGSGTIIVNGQTNIGSFFNDTQTIYDSFITQTPNQSSSASDISGTTWIPGVISLSASTVTITGGSPITLNGRGTYVFQIPSGNLVTDPTSAPVQFVLINGALASLVSWAVNGNANLQTISGNITEWVGSMIVQGNITLGTGSTSAGSLGAPSASGTITLNANVITSQVSQEILDNISNNYQVLQTTLSDSKAIQLNALSENGGISMTAGFGGISMETTNSINMTSGNASSLIVTGAGSIDIVAQQGLLNLDGKSGINIGRDVTYGAAVINIGSGTETELNLYANDGGISATTASGGPISLAANGASSNFSLVSTGAGQDLTFALTGNHDSSLVISSTGTGAAAINLQTSAGGISLSSVGDIQLSSSAEDSASSLYLNTTGNVLIAANKTILLISADPSPTAIQLSTAAAPGGGISLNSGGAGIVLDSYNGGATAGGIGVVAGAAGLSMNAYGGGIIGIGHFNGGEIQLGTAAVGRPIVVGNDTTTTSVALRTGPSGVSLISQPAPTDLGITSTTATIAQLLTRVLFITPTVAETVTLDTASNIVTALAALVGLTGIHVNDAFDFNLINLSTAVNAAVVTVAPGTGGTSLGDMNIAAIPASGSGAFRIQITNVGTPAYTVIRLA